MMPLRCIGTRGDSRVYSGVDLTRLSPRVQLIDEELQ